MTLACELSKFSDGFAKVKNGFLKMVVLKLKFDLESLIGLKNSIKF